MIIKAVDQIHHKIRKPTYRDFLKDEEILIKGISMKDDASRTIIVEPEKKGRIIDVRV